MNVRLQTENDIADIENLLDITFGTDRFSKAAYSLRDGVNAVSALSFVIDMDKNITGTLRFWEISIEKNDKYVDALLLGPIAILPRLQGLGLGIKLMESGLSEAKKLGHKRVLLVGDEAYYKRIGFSRDIAENIAIPGQHEESRILAKELVKGSFSNVAGIVRKRHLNVKQTALYS